MKRLTTLFLAFAMCISLCACSNSTEKTYIPPENIELTYTGVCGYNDVYNDLIHIIENHSGRVIKNIKIATANFDRNGFYIDPGIGSVYLDYSSINLLSDENAILKNYGVEGNVYYIRGVIAKVEFMDGEIWESDAIETWLEDMESGIDVNEEKAVIDNMKELADKAEKNDYMTLQITDAFMDNHRWANIDYSVDVFNTMGKAISSFEILVLCFDKNGFPVHIGEPHLASNSTVYEDKSSNITEKEYRTGYFSWPFTFSDSGDVALAKGIISKVSFTNGDVWENQYAPYWELYYGDFRGK